MSDDIKRIAERKAIVAWLRDESALATFRSETCSEDMEAEIYFRAEHFADAANAIEAGSHLKGIEHG